MPALANGKHEAFCQAMASGVTVGNAAASYAAVYNKNRRSPCVRGCASRLNGRLDIWRRIRELQAQVQTIEAEAIERAIDKLAITKESILAELARIGFANMLDYVQPTGDVVNVSALSRDQAAAIQEVIVDYQTGRGEESRDVKRVLVACSNHSGVFRLLQLQRG
jgi:phage terminase small subunit